MSTQPFEANAILDERFPTLLIGRDHRVSYANPRAHQLFGYSRDGLLGMWVEQLLTPQRRTEVRNIQAVLAGQGPRRWRSTTRQASGAWIDVNLALEPCVDFRGEIAAVMLRCERILPSRSPKIRAFGAVSGTRPILALSEGRASSTEAQHASPSPREPPEPIREGSEGEEQLETALQLLSWLRTCIEDKDGPLGHAREQERERALRVLAETTELVAQYHASMKRG